MSTFGQCAAFCAGDPEFDHRRDHKSFFRLFFLFTWRSWTPGGGVTRLGGVTPISI